MVTVSVVIPVFNGEAVIGAAVESALAQRFDDFEVIVIDDGSTDATLRVLEGYRSRLQLLQQENRGPAAARNAACRVARGRYLAFLDADDTWMPDKLAACVPLLDRDGAAVLVFSDAIPVDGCGRRLRESYAGELGRAPSMADLLTRWWPIVPSTAVLRRDAFVACGGFAEEFRGAGYEDPFLWLRMREQGEFRYNAKALARYREANPAQRIEKYLRFQDIFVRLVHDRFGTAGHELIRSTRRGYVSALGYEGLMALRRGDRIGARRHFSRAFRHSPGDLRNTLRLLRTLLPLRIAQALSGRTGRPIEN
ncbi:MAG: glycosyltransferase family 2 protein [Candidatus Binataceae bacterium]